VYGTYDAQDRMHSYGDASYGYTPNGSLKYKAVNGDTTWYNYDLLGNLVSITLPNGDFIAYIIDGQNRRVGKMVNGEFKKGWLYQDQLNPVAELDSDGNVISRFVCGTKGHVPDYMVKNDTTYRFITDHLGSVRLVVKAANGHVAQRLDYDEFGNVLVNTNEGFQPFGYAGGLFDGETGLVRFGARDYDAGVGRWTAKDPIGFGGQAYNLYLYVFNSPLNGLDPFGLKKYIIANASGYFGYKFIGGEGGTFFVIDKSTGDAYGYMYGGISFGPSLGGGMSLEVGVVDLDNPTELKGLGINISGFATAKFGASFQIIGNLKKGVIGKIGGLSVGGGAGIGFLFTLSKFDKKYKLNELPEEILKLIEEFLEKNQCGDE
jgi:RHS repeat-associated protein